MANTSSSYEALADEYYDAVRHPTSANFREASRILLKQWLPMPNDGSRVCEVGAGRSLVAELLFSQGMPTFDLDVVDASPSMLAHSSQWESERVRLVRADAQALPHNSETFDILVSILGDPYNTPAFWSEARRVLRPHGKVIFTTPSFAWAKAFRKSRPAAEFLMAEGSQIEPRSLIHPRLVQTRMIADAGFSNVEAREIRVGDLVATDVSWKLLPARGRRASVVTGYRATAA